MVEILFLHEILLESSDRETVYSFEQELIKLHIKDPLCLNLSFQDLKKSSNLFNIAGFTPYRHTITQKVRYCSESPGPEWEVGTHNKGKKSWFNETTGQTKYNAECPGMDWVPGNSSNGKTVWVNGDLIKYCDEKPGNDWVKGHTNTGKRPWVNTLTGQQVWRNTCPGDNWKCGSTNLKKVWINPTTQEEILAHHAPSEEWQIRSPTLGTKAWTKDSVTVYREVCPGEGWYNGLTRTNSWHKLTCQHCGKSVDNGNFNRWHGDKCKVKRKDS